MKEMIEQLLQLARNHEQIAFKFEETDIYRANRKDITTDATSVCKGISIGRESPAIAVTDVEKLSQLLFILLDNARKYSDE